MHCTARLNTLYLHCPFTSGQCGYNSTYHDICIVRLPKNGLHCNVCLSTVIINKWINKPRLNYSRTCWVLLFLSSCAGQYCKKTNRWDQCKTHGLSHFIDALTMFRHLGVFDFFGLHNSFFHSTSNQSIISFVLQLPLAVLCSRQEQQVPLSFFFFF